MSWGTAGLWVRPGSAGVLERELSARTHQVTRFAAGGRKGAGPEAGVEAGDGSTQGHSGWLWGLWLPRPGIWVSRLQREESLGCVRVGHAGESGYRVTVELWDLGRESWGTIPHPSLEHRGGFTIVAITPLSARAPARVARGLS